MLQQVPTVLVVLVVRNVQADFVQRRCPLQQVLMLFQSELPIDADVHQQLHCTVAHALGVVAFDVIATRQVGHGVGANVVVMETPQHVEQQTLSQRAVRGL